MIRKAAWLDGATFDARLWRALTYHGYARPSDLLRHLDADGPPLTAGLAVDLTRYVPFADILEPEDTPPVLAPLVGRTDVGPVPGFGACVVHPNGIPLYVFCYLDYRERFRALLPYNENPFNRLARRPFGQEPLDDRIVSEQQGFTSYADLKEHAMTDGRRLYDIDRLTHALHHFVRVE